jgi:hypothetical protein
MLQRHKQTQTPNLPIAYALETIDGYDGGLLPLQRYVNLKLLFPAEGDNVVDGRLWVQLRTAPDPMLLGWLNVRYLILDRSSDSSLVPADYRLVYDGDARIYENRAVLPRAYVVGRARVVADGREALAALASPSFDPGAEAVVEAGDLAAAGVQPIAGQSGEARIVEYSPERGVIETSPDSPGLLVLTDASYPGWRALVDGTERPILTANYLFRGVFLAPGTHRIELVFEPASLRAGLAIGGVAALVALALVLLPLAGRRQVARRGVRGPEGEV